MNLSIPWLWFAVLAVVVRGAGVWVCLGKKKRSGEAALWWV
ncbi:hypothetical protein [Vibrio navarrensis]|nr:hypothetical protein [Vibrio navarrensis]